MGEVRKKAENIYGKIYFLHDNARPHVSKLTREKLLSFKWTILPHPPYSPDISPTDYHLFHSLSSHLKDKKFDHLDELKLFLKFFFEDKTEEFYRSGIHSLPNRWLKIVDNNGIYYDERY